MLELNQAAIEYFNSFDWDAFKKGNCVPGTWQNCCVESVPTLCMGESTALTKGVKTCSGGCHESHGNPGENAAVTAIHAAWTEEQVHRLIDKLRSK